METKMNRIDYSKSYPNWLYNGYYKNALKKTEEKKEDTKGTDISLNNDLLKENKEDLTQVKSESSLLPKTEAAVLNTKDTDISLSNDLPKENKEDLTQVKSESSLLPKTEAAVLNTKNNFDPFIALERLGSISKYSNKQKQG